MTSGVIGPAVLVALHVLFFVVVSFQNDQIHIDGSTLTSDYMTLTATRHCSVVKCRCTQVSAQCDRLSLTRVPEDLPKNLQQLDLRHNNLENDQELKFESYNNLKRVFLDYNNLKSIPDHSFINLQYLEDLSLRNNKLTKVPATALIPLKNLQKLFLSSNLIKNLSEIYTKNSNLLKQLWLDDNRIKNIPLKTLKTFHQLDVLNLGKNKIRRISTFPQHSLSNLIDLLLGNNIIELIEARAFSGLLSLKKLELHNNRLEKVPRTLSYLKKLEKLSLSGNRIDFISFRAFHRNKNLKVVTLEHNPLHSVDVNAFSNLPYLEIIILPNLQHQKKFLNLTRSRSLRRVEIDRSSLQQISEPFCSDIPILDNLVIKSSQLQSIPNLFGCLHLIKIDLSYGHITEIENEVFKHQTKLLHLHLAFNRIKSIKMNSFFGLENIQLLDLEGNQITVIHPEAFLVTPKLNDLNIGNNELKVMPTAGLKKLRVIKVHNNVQLTTFPSSPSIFPNVHKLVLSYAYHCCAFINSKENQDLKSSNNLQPDSEEADNLKESVIWMKHTNIDMDIWSQGESNQSTSLFYGFNDTSDMDELARDYWDSSASLNWTDIGDIHNNEAMIKRRLDAEGEEAVYWRLNKDISCSPRPGPFLPCDDLFGWWTLRCGIWIVFLLALLGNGAVVVVLTFSRTKMDVPRFLVCNLAIADFFMGIYLGFLAMVDASTLGEFKSFAVRWQFSAGCQIAGFLGVLSSELSVFTLSVITLERHYAITHAMHLNKRLSLRHASYIMTVGWTFSLTLATLPLLGISDYRKFAVCLPFEVGSKLSLGYVIFLMLINGAAFTILMGCYLKMYCSIRGSQAWNSNDCRIAKRMALLVFTDFFCWAPIAFFAFFAVGGLTIISTEGAKVLTIFVLPFNSCANPFLYAITTKQFKKDCVVICKRIEESRVTRGIGRRRNSSNFSNRQNEPLNSVNDEKFQFYLKNKTNHLNNAQDYNKSLLNSPAEMVQKSPEKKYKGLSKIKNFFCDSRESIVRGKNNGRDCSEFRIKSDVGHSKFARKGKKSKDFASSVSSENFSSRSDSWRNNSIPLRLLDRNVMASAMMACGNAEHELCHRKASQESDMSSRLDSSTTSTFRISRSSITSTDGQSSGSKASITPVSSLKGDKRSLQRKDSDEANAAKSSFSSLRERASNQNNSGPCCSYNSEMRKPRLCRQAALDEPRPVNTPPMSPLATNNYPERKKSTTDVFCNCNSELDSRGGQKKSRINSLNQKCQERIVNDDESIKNRPSRPTADKFTPIYLTSKLPVLPECRSKSDDGQSTD